MADRTQKTNEMTSEKLEELRRIAKDATPGLWAFPHQKDPYGCYLLPLSENNASYIAAFDPTTCLTMLDRIEALEQERDAALGEVEKLCSVIRDLLPIAEARVAWEEEYESDALSSTSWIEPKRRVIARAKEVLGDDAGGDTHA